MRKMKRWKSTFGVLALALLLTVGLAPTAAFAEAAAAGGTAAGEAAGQPAVSASTPAPDNQAVDNKTEKRIEEPAVDEKTTAPNNVKEAAPSDDKQGSDISYNYEGHVSILGFDLSFTGEKTPQSDRKTPIAKKRLVMCLKISSTPILEKKKQATSS